MVAHGRRRGTQLSSDARFDYTTIGHVTIDVLADGTRRPGGAAFYSALQAARLGQRTRILTQGVVHEIEQLLDPHRDEFALEVIPAGETTTLATRGTGSARQQRLLAWAGPMAADLQVNSAILHLAPVARETPASWSGAAGFIGLTPQGLTRTWAGEGTITLAAPSPEAAAVAARCDALVLSAEERASCAELIELATSAGSIVVVTAGPGPNTILKRDGRELEVEVAALAAPSDDLGAGDVFAAALFVGLSQGRAEREATDFANAAAAVRMQGVGAGAVGHAPAIEARLAHGRA
jgi:sugar/nucleoside kinase (ribokinase family)